MVQEWWSKMNDGATQGFSEQRTLIKAVKRTVSKKEKQPTLIHYGKQERGIHSGGNPEKGA